MASSEAQSTPVLVVRASSGVKDEEADKVRKASLSKAFLHVRGPTGFLASAVLGPPACASALSARKVIQRAPGDATPHPIAHVIVLSASSRCQRSCVCRGGFRMNDRMLGERVMIKRVPTASRRIMAYTLMQASCKMKDFKLTMHANVLASYVFL